MSSYSIRWLGFDPRCQNVLLLLSIGQCGGRVLNSSSPDDDRAREIFYNNNNNNKNNKK